MKPIVPTIYMYEAIRQRWHENRPFDLKYNVLDSNSDYLIVGQTSMWLEHYNKTIVLLAFRPLVQFGEYQLLRRVR